MSETATGAVDSAAAILAPGGVSVRTPPENLSREDEELFAHEASYTWPETRLTVVPNVTIGRTGMLFQGLDVLPQNFPSRAHYEKRRKLRAVRRAALERLHRRQTVTSGALWITDMWSQNYFHWLCDCLPRLEAAIGAAAPPVALALPSAVAHLSFVPHTLTAFPDIETITTVGPNAAAHCAQLRIPSPTAGTGNYNDLLIRQVAERLRRRLAPGAPSEETGVYISRANAGSRRVVNEAEMAAALTHASVASHIFEDLTPAEQIATASAAGRLVSIHGAGLSNMIFMKPGSLVVEIRARGDSHNNCYYALASALGHRYRYVLADKVSTTEAPATADVVVSVDALRAALQP